ncbi:MAG: DUF1330 domain-containing protein [Alphaproteobacteria bacterium]|nr:MAG: DUF1330 domain-containing protein [Alphaproteobacteria bacterium]
MTGHIDPSAEHFAAFKALNRDQPILMINLVRLKEKAVYADGTETTGAAAYKAYGKESGPIFQRVGGTIVWRGKPETLVIGPADEHWDLAFVARYPTAHAFLEMVTDPDYRKAVKHRQAGVADSRLIRCGELDGAGTFG